MRYVYHIEKKGERTFWTKVGVAFDKEDGTTDLMLDSCPVDGKLTISRKKDK